MEDTYTPTEQHTTAEPLRGSFHGKGSDLFGLIIINTILTYLTLTIYYPWYRAKLLTYLYSQTEFQGSRFEFHGTGAEMFRGYIKAVVLIGLVYGLIITGQMTHAIGLVFIGQLLILCLIPLIIHGALRYRLSRTSWRGIHFSYHGDLGDLYSVYIKGLFLTIITFGIYGFWLNINLHKYTENKIQFGNTKLGFQATGWDYLGIIVQGYFLTIITLGIYSFWWYVSMQRFFIEKTWIEQDGKPFRFRTSMDGWSYLKLQVVNILMLIFTLGIAYPWVRVRSLRYFIDHLTIEAGFNPDLVQQEGDNYADATGDDLFSMLDLPIT